MSEEAKKLMKELNKKYNAELSYNVSREDFYVYTNMDYTDGMFDYSICEHGDTPDEAIYAFDEKINEIKHSRIYWLMSK